MGARKETAPATAATATRAQDEGLGRTSQQMIAQRRKRFAREAEEWIAENEGAWSYMVKAARGYASQNRRFGMQELAEQVRRRDFTDSHGRTTKVNNNHVAALARLLMAEVPACRQLIERRTSAYDGLIG
ncbi:hypothetical protein [Lancefieldella sp. Marseille-Q7238]|uniref:hypothetical protein n=1 Tax=Lancefieldella sp. Marseille-Q7238 TaxID=3022127 RepID=UPI0024A92D04|nr:hypothetical protein [Lancefieldella sp. Marseille-Q7238]